MPIAIPAKVKVAISGKTVNVEGPKGKLSLSLPRRTSLKVEDNKIVVSRDGEDAEAKAMHGLGRALINNMVIGVTDGYVKKLEINGVGFKAAVQGKVVNMSLGYSHPINYPIPDQITVKVDENTKITIEGPDKQVVGKLPPNCAAFIRRNLTKARVLNTPMRRSSARKARLFSNLELMTR
jgi:large subunit ribosomal protein L6